MPLRGTGTQAVYDARRSMIGVWMRLGDRGPSPVEGARVFVTLDALWQLEPPGEQTIESAMAIFEKRREFLENKAGTRFDSNGPEAGEFFKGRPVVVLTTSDLRPW